MIATNTTIATLLELGCSIRKKGIKLYKSKKPGDFPYKVNVQKSKLKGNTCDGEFSTLDLAIACFKERLELIDILKAEDTKYL